MGYSSPSQDLFPHPKTPTSKSHKKKTILDLELEPSEEEFELDSLSEDSTDLNGPASHANSNFPDHSRHNRLSSSSQSTSQNSGPNRFTSSQEK
jgi:hypothetical protein